MSKGVFTALTRAACWTRAKGRCEICGATLPEKGWNLHHRENRGMGGAKRPLTCADGLVVCGSGTTGCHGRITQQPRWAYSMGYVVRRNGHRRPAEVPVLDLNGDWIILLADGRTRRAEFHELLEVG